MKKFQISETVLRTFKWKIAAETDHFRCEEVQR